ncbi:hypothetical protein Cob_v002159 [Colletotrichum orbiculare MAFF 240422]|uniref:GPI anchored serine-rich protein n=1 Tax=Colletotrichum orbiculare (strain 104-T / ATCC 96160 / CBS 514.97 / LARS 414 / MAFF 240422) TaxID=1213857 RepID=N4VK71_COLOR|nr:hypothetical protein Cob_v002159 [Colletotrichum orbiculare MAFF 240422]
MRFTTVFALMAASVAVAQSADETTTTLTSTTTKVVTITKCNPTNTACPLYTPTSTILPTFSSTTSIIVPTTSSSSSSSSSSYSSSSSSSSFSSSHFYPAANSTAFAGPTASAPWTTKSGTPIKTADAPGATTGAASPSSAPNAGSGLFVQTGLMAAVVGFAVALN